MCRGDFMFSLAGADHRRHPPDQVIVDQIRAMHVFVKLWNGKEKGRAAVQHAFGPDSAPVALDNALDIGQSDARAGKLSLAVQALKDAEELAGILRIEARAVVAHKNHVLILAAGNAADFDPGL